jgi:hypothetical protein
MDVFQIFAGIAAFGAKVSPLPSPHAFRLAGRGEGVAKIEATIFAKASLRSLRLPPLGGRGACLPAKAGIGGEAFSRCEILCSITFKIWVTKSWGRRAGKQNAVQPDNVLFLPQTKATV